MQLPLNKMTEQEILNSVYDPNKQALNVQIVRGSQSAASATALTLPAGSTVYKVTGTTEIDAITTGDYLEGDKIELFFSTSVTLGNNKTPGGGQKAMKLAGGADFSATDGSNIALVLIGSFWQEVSRSVNHA